MKKKRDLNRLLKRLKEKTLMQIETQKVKSSQISKNLKNNKKSQESRNFQIISKILENLEIFNNLKNSQKSREISKITKGEYFELCSILF